MIKFQNSSIFKASVLVCLMAFLLAGCHSGQKQQKILCHSGDHITIDWAYLYLAAETNQEVSSGGNLHWNCSAWVGAEPVRIDFAEIHDMSPRDFVSKILGDRLDAGFAA